MSGGHSAGNCQETDKERYIFLHWVCRLRYRGEMIMGSIDCILSQFKQSAYPKGTSSKLIATLTRATWSTWWICRLHNDSIDWQEMIHRSNNQPTKEEYPPNSTPSEYKTSRASTFNSRGPKSRVLKVTCRRGGRCYSLR